MQYLVCRLAVLSLAAVSASCTQGTPSTPSSVLGPGSVATVNGSPVPESVFRVHALSATKKNADDLTAEERKAVLDDLVGIVVMAQEADKQGLLAERTTAAQMELARLQLSARAMATRYLEENPATELEIKTIYDENLPRLAGQQFKARHILVDTKEEADAIIEQLNGGKDFLKLAEERASGKTGPNGGDLGWFTADSMTPPVVEAVSAMKVGSHSTEPVKTDYGYHVLLLEDTRSQEPPSINDMRDEIVNAVQREKLQKHMRELVEAANVVE
jgi:peptidyl-prolyl cis-trans isomerase C